MQHGDVMSGTGIAAPPGAVAFAVELPDGTVGVLGWMAMDKFEWWQRTATLREGCRYVFAFPGTQWQPIETAPRDSRKILVGGLNVHGEWRTHLAWWRLPYEGAPDEQCSWCYDKDLTLLDASIHSCGATHWMPLPPPPETAP